MKLKLSYIFFFFLLNTVIFLAAFNQFVKEFLLNFISNGIMDAINAIMDLSTYKIKKICVIYTFTLCKLLLFRIT